MTFCRKEYKKSGLSQVVKICGSLEFSTKNAERIKQIEKTEHTNIKGRKYPPFRWCVFDFCIVKQPKEGIKID